MIKIKLYEYQVNELLIILNSIIHEFFYEIKISIYEGIRCILQDSLIKEQKQCRIKK